MGLDEAWEQELETIKGCPRIGVYGGTFDPIHTGHLIVAEEAFYTLNLDQVLFVPANTSPLKQGKSSASLADRLEMVRLAIDENPHFLLSHVDAWRPAPSFTFKTLELLSLALPGTELFFIMGMDSLLTFHHWKAPERIIELAHVVVVTRPGSEPAIQQAFQALPSLRERGILINTLQIGISSTNIRERLQAGRPVRYQVPRSVEHYLYSHHLYI